MASFFTTTTSSHYGFSLELSKCFKFSKRRALERKIGLFYVSVKLPTYLSPKTNINT